MFIDRIAVGGLYMPQFMPLLIVISLLDGLFFGVHLFYILGRIIWRAIFVIELCASSSHKFGID